MKAWTRWRGDVHGGHGQLPTSPRAWGLVEYLAGAIVGMSGHAAVAKRAPTSANRLVTLMVGDSKLGELQGVSAGSTPPVRARMAPWPRPSPSSIAHGVRGTRADQPAGTCWPGRTSGQLGFLLPAGGHPQWLNGPVALGGKRGGAEILLAAGCTGLAALLRTPQIVLSRRWQEEGPGACADRGAALRNCSVLRRPR
jgi:hypothetical protein